MAENLNEQEQIGITPENEPVVHQAKNPLLRSSSYEGQAKNQLAPKGLLAIITVLAVVALFASVQQWVKSLRLPFLIPESERSQSANNNSNANQGISDLLALQNKDTDGDGLSDYDELYLYYTSPYLEDSDSDGFNDAEEIKTNHNPNCPEGQTCQTLNAAQGNQAPTDLNDLANVSTEQIKQMLMSQGLSAEEVNKFSEAELRQVYDETLKAFQQPDYLNNLAGQAINITPAQIREMLVSQGMKQEEVNKFSDEELTTLWQEVAAQAQTEQ